MKKNQSKLFMLMLVAVILGSCANREIVDACLKGDPYGFWGGLWHGIIAPIDLVVMLFKEDVTMFAQNNNGAWYSFGFLLGSGGWGVLGSRGRKKK